MSFFDDPPPDMPPMPQPRKVAWRGTSDDTLGQPVPFAAVLAKSDDVAVIVSGIVAYPSGFGLNVSAIRRMESMAPLHAFDLHRWPGEDRDPQKLLQFGLQFADGSKATSRDHPIALHQRQQRGERTLSSRGGGGGGRKWTQGFSCSPLPPPGPLSFVVQWLEFDIEQTELQIDAALILDAAERAEPIWPEDVGLAEE